MLAEGRGMNCRGLGTAGIVDREEGAGEAGWRKDPTFTVSHPELVEIPRKEAV